MVYALKFYFFFLLLSPISSVSIICILYSHGFSFVLYIDDNKARVTGEWKKVVHSNNNNYYVGRICAKGKASENFKKTTHTLTHTTKQLTFCSFIILLLTLFILFGVCVYVRHTLWHEGKHAQNNNKNNDWKKRKKKKAKISKCIAQNTMW